LADAGVPATFHGGTNPDEMQIISPAWRSIAPTLRPPAGDADAGNIHAFPFIWTTAHLPAEVALTFMVLGGVFERHPRLRFAVIELGASWVAPWCARMDTIATASCSYLARHLSQAPSQYVRRQVRVTPFFFEPIGEWIRRDGLGEVYVFSTDYPHIEGGDDPIGRFLGSLDQVDDSIIEQFFVGNAAELVAV
jgi:predicted TIM-barrel fold metal-dependent hydrolase